MRETMAVKQTAFAIPSNALSSKHTKAKRKRNLSGMKTAKPKEKRERLRRARESWAVPLLPQEGKRKAVARRGPRRKPSEKEPIMRPVKT